MSFIKLITESLNTKTNFESPILKSNFTVEELDKLILEDTNNLISIKAKYEDLKSTWRSLKEDFQTFSFYNHMNSGTNIKEQFQKAIDDLKLEYKDTMATLNAHKEQRNKLLLENTSDNLNINDKLRDKYYPVFEKLQSIINTSNIYDIFEYLFNSLVPKQGKAETKAGEIIRALMRIIYEFKSSEGKLVFYEGEGKDKFGNAAKFLKDMGYEEYLNSAIGNVEDKYLNSIKLIIENILRDFVLNGEELFYTQNLIDYNQITSKE